MLFQADALQKHRNSTVSKSDDFSTVEFIGRIPFLSPATSTRTVYTTFDKGHGRIEWRIYTLDTHIGWFEQKKEWKNRAALAIIRRILYNRIKMLSKLETLSMEKRACIYDDEFRAKILFSC